MNDHIYRKFPDDTQAIQSLLQKDAAFREIYAEYEEMSTWLASQYPEQPRPAKEYDDARDLLRNLEQEIRKALRKAGF